MKIGKLLMILSTSSSQPAPIPLEGDTDLVFSQDYVDSLENYSVVTIIPKMSTFGRSWTIDFKGKTIYYDMSRYTYVSVSCTGLSYNSSTRIMTASGTAYPWITQGGETLNSITIQED